MATVSQRDRELFRKLGEALNPPIVKITKEEKIKSFDLAAYFSFLDESRQLIIGLKGFIFPSETTGIENGHERAKKLGLLRYV